MKKSLLEKNRIPEYIVELIARLVKRIEWSERRRAMADVTLTLLEGKARIAEEVFGWGRSTVKLGIEELKSGMVCVNDLSRRRKPKTEEKCPELLRAIRLIMDPASQAQSHLIFLYQCNSQVGAFNLGGKRMERSRVAKCPNNFQYFEPTKLSSPARGKISSQKKTSGRT
jgi:hypothetical protein